MMFFEYNAKVLTGAQANQPGYFSPITTTGIDTTVNIAPTTDVLAPCKNSCANAFIRTYTPHSHTHTHNKLPLERGTRGINYLMR